MQSRIEIIRRPLRNQTCPYCGVALDDATATKEHVVGRHFVPKGSLNQSLNVILRSCHPCNQRKSDLEDDISALSMYPDLGRGFDGMGDVIPGEAKRKLAKSYSRTTCKPIVDSSEEHIISGMPLPGLKMSASFTSPPQMDEARVYKLAHYQVRGLFYALTFNPDTMGGLWPDGGFFPVAVARRTDWGNPIHLWFMKRVMEWHERMVGYFADEHFRVAIRRDPGSELWSFALEWNRSTRVIGFFGRQEPALAFAKEIPQLPMVVIGTSPDGGVYRGRSETPLAEVDDCLFYAHDSLPRA